VTTNHSLFSEERREIYRSIHQRVAIIAISHDQASRSKDVNIARVIHHGLDPEAYSLGAGGGGYLLFLGRMAPDKGVRTAIRVARASGRRLLIAAKLQEVGEHRYFEERVRPLLNDDVEFLGEVDRSTERDLLAEAEALLNPINWAEPFGLVMIEALASGTPVVAFRRGAAPEIVEHGINGYLCDHEVEMTEALGRLGALDRQTCRRSFMQRFTAARMVGRHLSLYEDLVRARDLAPGMVDAGN
jgi:glycosyltransferase involved in cell wall biosynthesis